MAAATPAAAPPSPAAGSGAPVTKGFLVKRGRIVPSWLRRWCELDGSELSYFTAEGQKAKGSMSIKGCTVTRVKDDVFGRPNCIEVTGDGRTLFLCAENAPDLARWMTALTAGANAGKAAGAGGGGSGASSAPGTPIEDGASDSKVALPRLVVLGRCIEGRELNAHVLGNLGTYSITWFRTQQPAEARTWDAVPPTDATGVAGFTYVATQKDVGYYVGCAVASSWPRKCSVGLSPGPIRGVDPMQQPYVRIQLRPHVHSKYCDRKQRVCQAPGRYREAEILELEYHGPAELRDKLRCRWFKSARLFPAAGCILPAEDLAKQPEIPNYLDPGIEFLPAIPRSLTCLPPLPSASEASGPPVKKPEMVDIPAEDPFSTVFPLLADDIGRLFKVELHYADGSGEPIVSDPVGPVEAGPPVSRELWIEGRNQVGLPLIAHSYYFGGIEGPSEYWWLKITQDGDRVDLTTPTACDPTAPVPGIDDAPGDVDKNSRVYRPTAEDVGCNIKVMCRPLRNDNEAGYPSTSRPTPAIQPGVTAAADPAAAQ